MNIRELNAVAHDLMQVRAMIKKLEAEADELTDEIKAHMEAQGIDELTGDSWSASWKEVQSKRFDKAAMVQAFGQDCYNRFCRTTAARRFSLTA